MQIIIFGVQITEQRYESGLDITRKEIWKELCEESWKESWKESTALSRFQEMLRLSGSTVIMFLSRQRKALRAPCAQFRPSNRLEIV